MNTPGSGSLPVDVAGLLAHRRWLARLARDLVAGAADAEDAVQETWLAALRTRLREPSRARPWLGQVLRNALRRQARGAERRRRREQAVAEGATVEPAAAGLERLELQRRLTELVAALDEPFRSTVVLRYFEDRPAADIARALGVPEGTVRWRTREALARLRRALDQQQGGDRAAWAPALGLLAGRSIPAPVGLGVLALLSAGAIGLVVVIAAGTIAGARGRRPADAHGALARAEAAVPSSSAAPVGNDTPRPSPALVARALALASRPLPPAEALARARAAWTAACTGDEIDGLCVTRRAPPARVCPQAAAAGERLVAVRRRPELRAEALALWEGIARDKQLPIELRAPAELALAEDKLEAMLAVEPAAGLDLDKRDPQRFNQEQERFAAWAREAGMRAREASDALKRLAGAWPDQPEPRMARARLGQAGAEGGRLRLWMEIPTGLSEKNRWGKSEPALFCESIARNANAMFASARRNLIWCRDGDGAPNAQASALCARELARLPPPIAE